MSRSHLGLADSTGPLPYELYIKLDPLAATWPSGEASRGTVVACCGFQAAELVLRLMDDALGDSRAEAFPQLRIERFVGHLVDGLELTCRLLRQCDPSDIATTIRPERAPSPGLAVLPRLDRGHVDQVTRRLVLAGAGLPFRIGVEEQLRLARQHHNLPDLNPSDLHALDLNPPDLNPPDLNPPDLNPPDLNPPDLNPPDLGSPLTTPGVPVMDYAAVVAPATVSALREPTPYGPEDHLFSTAHQITECWLHIAHRYLDEAGDLASQQQWAAAAGALRDACDTIAVAAQAGQLLDLMVLADYHPLRVRLRDGSGAQSRAVRQLLPAVRAAARPLWAALEADNRSLLDVLEQPAVHTGPYQYLNGLKAIGKRIQSFLFEHYLLALGVLGTHSLGSAGYETRKLAERAAQPLFPEINQAQHDYVMITNFRHGDSSGSIVLRNEVAHGWNPYQVSDRQAACPREVMEARIADYFRLIEQRDADEWVKLFDPVHGHLEDVPGTRPYLGQAHLRVFINGMFNAFTEMRGSYSTPRVDGSTASVAWHFDAVSYHGQDVAFDGREEFVFAEDGRILRAVADWSPAEVARQWRPGLQGQRASRRSLARQRPVGRPAATPR